MKKTYIAPAITELKMENNAIMAASGTGTAPGGNILDLTEETDPFGNTTTAKRSDLWEE